MIKSPAQFARLSAFQTWEQRRRLVKQRAGIAAAVALTTLVSATGTAQSFDPPMDEPLMEPVIYPDPVDALADAPDPDSSLGAASASFGEGFAAAAASAPVTAAGRTPGSFAVTTTGASTYRIPIWKPPSVGTTAVTETREGPKSKPAAKGKKPGAAASGNRSQTVTG